MAAALAAYVLGAILAVPGVKTGALGGTILHPSFGVGEFGEVFGLAWAASFLAVRRRVRPLARALLCAFGFAVFALGLLALEARLQNHGILAEAVIAARFGSRPAIIGGALAVAAGGLALAAVAPELLKFPRTAPAQAKRRTVRKRRRAGAAAAAGDRKRRR